VDLDLSDFGIDAAAMRVLLASLRDGRAHSCDDLAGVLGVGADQVRQAVRLLQGWGLRSGSGSDRLYRFPFVPELLDRAAIEAALPCTLRQNLGMVLYLSTDSTNDRIWSQSDRSETWQVCLADHQSRGRGRRGRVWHSPLGGVLCLSLLWRPQPGLASLDGLSLCVGLVLLQAVEALGIGGLSLKWPNDVLAWGKKLAGTLIETRVSAGGQWSIVIGLGLNLCLAPEDISKLDQPAVDLGSLSSVPIDKAKLVAQLLVRLVGMLEQFNDYGFSFFRDAWCRYHAFSGRRLHLDTGDGESVSGLALGVDDCGALELQTGQGVRLFRVGDVTWQGVGEREHS